MTRIRLAELARRLGVSRAAVSKARAAGRIAAPGPDGLVDADDAQRQWKENTRQAMKAAAAEETGEETRPRGGQARYGSARARRELARAAREELTLAKERGSLIAVADANAAMTFIGATLRSLLDVLPDQAAPLVAPITDMDECHRLLSDACRDLLDRLGEAVAREMARIGAS